MIQSYEEFKNAVVSALQTKVAERLDAQREYISNSLLRGDTEIPQDSDTQTQSNAE